MGPERGMRYVLIIECNEIGLCAGWLIFNVIIQFELKETVV